MEISLSSDIALVLLIIAIAFVLLIQERLRIDLIALMVLAALALSGLVTPTEALSGFSNPAVITVWAVFILSGGLARSGVANRIGKILIRLAGKSEARIIIAIMLTAGLLSAFINNVGVAALLLPVVMDIARRLRISPSRLLMPLAFGTILGGMITLIGTPPNILVNNILLGQNVTPFRFFDFTPIGLVMLVLGTAYMSMIGRRMLPRRENSSSNLQTASGPHEDLYDIDERLFVVQIPAGSPLIGRQLAQSRIGAALELNVVAILRQHERMLAPLPATLLLEADQLVVEGRVDRMIALRNSPLLIMEGDLHIGDLLNDHVQFRELTLNSGSSLVSSTLFESDFRARFGITVLAIEHEGLAQRTNLQGKILQESDRLLVLGDRERLSALDGADDWLVSSELKPDDVQQRYHLDERVRIMRIPSDSMLVGNTLIESRLADAFGIAVLGIRRRSTTELLPDPEIVLQPEDLLLVEVWPEDLKVLRGLQQIQQLLGPLPDLESLQSDQVGLMEVVLSPFTTLVGKTLRELHFREKFGLSVLAIWRAGRAYRSGLRAMKLKFGDALLLYGPRSRLQLLKDDADFLVLTQSAQPVGRGAKEPLAILIMIGVVSSVILHWLPIELAAVIGATIMILLGVLTMEEAYRFIDWKTVFLIAGMLPLGVAMQSTGAAVWLARNVVDAVGSAGVFAILAGIFVLTTITSQFMPSAALVVIMVPIAISTAREIGISPSTLSMLIAVAASTNFLSPISHPANSLVMGPAGYRFSDFLKVGAPLTLLLLLAALLLVPALFPL
jgi:di/tricarboxylate transporter